MDTCARCGAELGVGRFCLNCGHRIGDPVPPPAPVTAPAAATPATPAAPSAPSGPPASSATATVSEADPPAVPVQAADPTPVPPLPPPPARSRPARSASAPARSAPASAAGSRPDPAPAPSTWDPERDLLPYHDAGDFGPEEPLGARGWIPWVVGAVALVALVLVLLRVFESDPVTEPTSGDAPASDASASDAGAGAGGSDGGSAPASEPDPSAPQGTGPRSDVATTATFAVPATAPPTTDLDGNLVAYDAAQMGDGNPATTWRTAGDATGQTVTITLAESTVLDRVGLVNGYAKQVAGVDWYPHNRRVLAVTWGFDDGSTVEQTLAERPGLQRLKVPPVETSTVTLRIDAVTPPGSGPLGRDYTAISEVSLLGRRAG